MVENKEREPMTALNVVILPDRAVFNKALTLSYRISRRFPSEFVLDSEDFRPHITMFQGYYPNKNIQKLISGLENMKGPKAPMNIELDDFQLSHETFVFWNCIKTAQLQELHERILSIANPLREGNVSPNTMDMYPTLPDNEKKMVDLTGSILNKELFHPNITITRLKHRLDEKGVLENIGKGEHANFAPYSVAVAHLGPHGTISDIVSEIPFNE